MSIRTIVTDLSLRSCLPQAKGLSSPFGFELLSTVVFSYVAFCQVSKRVGSGTYCSLSLGSSLAKADAFLLHSLWFEQPGPKDFPIQCFIKRNKKNSTFYLYLGLSNATVDKGKFLMAARRFRRGAHAEYIISLDADDLSQGSNAYVGKLRSDFWGTNFKIYDSQPPYDGAKASSTRSSQCFGSRRISPQVLAGNFDAGQITYKYNLLKSRVPRKMFCTLLCPSTQETWENFLKTKSLRRAGTTVLRNKAPWWHEHLRCWCLNFHGRVTVASVKNFQLVAAPDPSYPDSAGDGETVLLQFGKVDSDIFTMDYRQPLSAFQAFAICLSSFGTKLACE